MNIIIIISISLVLCFSASCSDKNTIPQELSFIEVSEGLPGAALWRENIDTVDLNGDGLLDIVIPPPRYHFGEPLQIFINQGNKWMPAIPNIPLLPYDYGWVESGPVGTTGYTSLFINAHHSSIYTLRGISPLLWTDSSTGLPSTYGGNYLDVGDIDNNGTLDIVSTTMTAYTQFDTQLTHIFLGNELGQWRQSDIQLPVQLSGNEIRLADFNNNGWLDIVVASTSPAIPNYVYMNRVGILWDPVLSGLPEPFYLMTLNVYDINSDAFDDLLLITYTYDHPLNTFKTEIYLGNSAGFSKSNAILKTSDMPVHVAAGFIDCDDKADIVIGTMTGIEVFLQKEGGLFQKAYDIKTPSYPGFIKVIDLFKKGSDDIVAAFPDVTIGGIKVWKNTLQCDNLRLKNLNNGKVLMRGSLRKVEYLYPYNLERLYLRANGELINIEIVLNEHGKIWFKVPSVPTGEYEFIIGQTIRHVSVN